MSRTPEQVAADEALTAAIEQALHAYDEGGQAWVLSEYVVITAQHRFDDEGDGITAIGMINRDSDVPLHRSLGLLQYAVARANRLITDDD